MEQLADRTAVITGAASGIGRALARRCAASGMRVVVADVEAARLADVAAEVRESGPGPNDNVLSVPTDVSDAAAVDRLAEASRERFGSVHLLCNNAGVFAGGLLWEAGDNDWSWVLGVNTYGIIHGIRSFVPAMIAAGEPAHVVNTSSMAGLISMPYSGPYVTSKFAAYALSESLAHDLATIGAPIGVSVLCPSLVATDIGSSSRNRPDDLPAAASESVALVEEALSAATREGLRPEVVADLVLEAVRSDTFLIPTKPSYADQIRGHTEALLSRELPEVPVID